MNMGQRALQLNNTYTVNNDGSIVYHVSQMPPNANIFQPGPAFVYVTIHGIPSNGSYVIVNSGNIETKITNAVDSLPPNVRVDPASGISSSTNSNSTNTGKNGASSLSGGAIGGIVAAAIAALAIFGTALSKRFHCCPCSTRNLEVKDQRGFHRSVLRRHWCIVCASHSSLSSCSRSGLVFNLVSNTTNTYCNEGGGSSSSRMTPSRPDPITTTQRLNQIYDAYNDGDETGVRGMLKWREDLYVNPEDVVLLSMTISVALGPRFSRPVT